MRGITLPDGGDLQLRDLRIEIGPDGNPQMASPTVVLRADLWPYWLAEAIDGAIDAAAHAEPIRETLAAGDEGAVNELLVHELRAAMRAVTSCAFAVDAFYAAVKERAGEHPQTAVWRTSGTSRYKQVSETLRYHLKVRDNKTAQEVKHRIKQLFQFRDWAVHPTSDFRGPLYRPDVDAAVPWQFSAFRSENATTAVAMAVDMINGFVVMLAKADIPLQEWQPRARELMDRVLDKYMATSLPPVLLRTPEPAGSQQAGQ